MDFLFVRASILSKKAARKVRKSQFLRQTLTQNSNNSHFLGQRWDHQFPYHLATTAMSRYSLQWFQRSLQKAELSPICSSLRAQKGHACYTMVPVLKKFPTFFSQLVKTFCFSLVFCTNFQYLITFNEVSESVDGLQIRVNLANPKIKKFSGHHSR